MVLSEKIKEQIKEALKEVYEGKVISTSELKQRLREQAKEERSQLPPFLRDTLERGIDDMTVEATPEKVDIMCMGYNAGVQVSWKLLTEFFKKNWGDRKCKEFHTGCGACEAWAIYDIIMLGGEGE